MTGSGPAASADDSIVLLSGSATKGTFILPESYRPESYRTYRSYRTYTSYPTILPAAAAAAKPARASGAAARPAAESGRALLVILPVFGSDNLADDDYLAFF